MGWFGKVALVLMVAADPGAVCTEACDGARAAIAQIWGVDASTVVILDTVPAGSPDAVAGGRSGVFSLRYGHEIVRVNARVRGTEWTATGDLAKGTHPRAGDLEPREAHFRSPHGGMPTCGPLVRDVRAGQVVGLRDVRCPIAVRRGRSAKLSLLGGSVVFQVTPMTGARSGEPVFVRREVDGGSILAVASAVDALEMAPSVTPDPQDQP